MELRTQKEVIRYFREKLATDPHYAIAGLKRIHSYQTASEQASNETLVHNNVGFTSCDAKILTSIYDFYDSYGFLSIKQMNILYKKMPKYSAQLFGICLGLGTVIKEGKIYKFVKKG